MNILDQASKIYEGSTIIRDWLGDGAQVVDQEVAQARADVCLKCPLHGEGNILTEAVADTIKKTIELKNRLKLRVQRERQLRTCKACECVMRLKIWMPPGRVQQVTDADTFSLLHEACWVRKEAA